MSDMFLNFTTGVEQESASPPVFGLEICRLDVPGVAARLASLSPPLRPGGRLFVTPNIQHISLMRRDGELRAAMAAAELITCDGFPVVRYARFRGCGVPGRVTGREVVDELMNRTELDPAHRLFFLVDSDETAAAVRGWTTRRGVRTEIETAPAQFGKDEMYCKALTNRLAAFGATILFLGVGAPRSELFAARYREQLPDGCWALCIGQSVKIALGLVAMPPRAVRSLNAEWLWRLMLEPKRLIGRYCDGTVGFALSVYDELHAAPSSAAVPSSGAATVRPARLAQIETLQANS